MARTVRPKSLRAVYGKDKGKNAVHCTDLIEDATLEVEYFFNILQKWSDKLYEFYQRYLPSLSIN